MIGILAAVTVWWHAERLPAQVGEHRAHDLSVEAGIAFWDGSGRHEVAPGANLPRDLLVTLTCSYSFTLLPKESTAQYGLNGGTLRYFPSTEKWGYTVLPWKGAFILNDQVVGLFDGETALEAKPNPTPTGTPLAASGSASLDWVVAKPGANVFRCAGDVEKKFREPDKEDNGDALSFTVLGTVSARGPQPRVAVPGVVSRSAPSGECTRDVPLRAGERLRLVDGGELVAPSRRGEAFRLVGPDARVRRLFAGATVCEDDAGNVFVRDSSGTTRVGRTANVR